MATYSPPTAFSPHREPGSSAGRDCDGAQRLPPPQSPSQQPDSFSRQGSQAALSPSPGASSQRVRNTRHSKFSQDTVPISMCFSQNVCFLKKKKKITYFRTEFYLRCGFKEGSEGRERGEESPS